MAILLVEDSPTNALILKRLVFKAVQAEVDIVDNGVDALALVNRNSYDLIIADQVLPGAMTGLQFIKALRMGDRHRTVPIVMVTSEYGEVLKLEASQLDIFAILPKPIDTLAFRMTVQRALGALAA